MADEADIASEIEQLHREAAFAAWIRPFEGESLEQCEDCGGEIPEARRQAIPGVTRCVECQTISEGRR